MDPITIEKLQSMKRYKLAAAASRRSIFYSFTRYTLSIFFFGLFLSCPLWIPKANSWFSSLIFVFVPSMRVFIFCPKCLFVVCNVIVMLLANESKTLCRNVVKVPADIYEEYARRQNHQLFTSSLPIKVVYDDEIKMENDLQEIAVVLMQEEEEEEEDQLEDELGREEVADLYVGLPREELNRRVEDFIAKVNKQRRMEARMLVCSG